MEKRRGRKVKGFYSILIPVCVLAALGIEFNWPLVVLFAMLYLTFAGLISAEDVLMAWIKKGDDADVEPPREV